MDFSSWKYLESKNFEIFLEFFSILNTSKNLKTALEWAENQNFFVYFQFFTIGHVAQNQTRSGIVKKLHNKRKYTIIY